MQKGRSAKKLEYFEHMLQLEFKKKKKDYEEGKEKLIPSTLLSVYSIKLTAHVVVFSNMNLILKTKLFNSI